MELLMDQGWIPALSIEAVILQIAATLVRGEGRINFAASKEEYTLERAQLGFEKLKSLPDRSRKIFFHFRSQYQFIFILFQRLDFKI